MLGVAIMGVAVLAECQHDGLNGNIVHLHEVIELSHAGKRTLRSLEAGNCTLSFAYAAHNCTHAHVHYHLVGLICNGELKMIPTHVHALAMHLLDSI